LKFEAVDKFRLSLAGYRIKPTSSALRIPMAWIRRVFRLATSDTVLLRCQATGTLRRRVTAREDAMRGHDLSCPSKFD
jgi:hypothetical protein